MTCTNPPGTVLNNNNNITRTANGVKASSVAHWFSSHMIESSACKDTTLKLSLTSDLGVVSCSVLHHCQQQQSWQYAFPAPPLPRREEKKYLDADRDTALILIYADLYSGSVNDVAANKFTVSLSSVTCNVISYTKEKVNCQTTL